MLLLSDARRRLLPSLNSGRCAAGLVPLPRMMLGGAARLTLSPSGNSKKLCVGDGNPIEAGLVVFRQLLVCSCCVNLEVVKKCCHGRIKKKKRAALSFFLLNAVSDWLYEEL